MKGDSRANFPSIYNYQEHVFSLGLILRL